MNDKEHSELDKLLDDWWNKVREYETSAINDLEKHLWLANGGALTISIGFLQSDSLVSC